MSKFGRGWKKIFTRWSQYASDCVCTFFVLSYGLHATRVIPKMGRYYIGIPVHRVEADPTLSESRDVFTCKKYRESEK